MSTKSLEKQRQMLQTKENPEPTYFLHPNHNYQVRHVGENLLAFSLP